jgi:hypothetical protein
VSDQISNIYKGKLAANFFGGPPKINCGTFFFFLVLPPLFKTTEVVVVGFQIFAWAPKYHNY